jgi:hypothetical protein
MPWSFACGSVLASGDKNLAVDRQELRNLEKTLTDLEQDDQ